MNTLFDGDLPKVGIRPTIDGRLGGVRESLEKQTMDLAKAVATMISKSLKYPNGKRVQCVIADTTIGGVAEAAACASKFRAENVGVSLTVTPCWCYGSETMDMDPHTPKAVWGFNGTERPGAVCLAAVLVRSYPCLLEPCRCHCTCSECSRKECAVLCVQVWVSWQSFV